MKDEMTSEMSNDSERRLRFRSYLELMRLPNVFTAMADVAMGFLFVQPSDWRWDPLAGLVDAGPADGRVEPALHLPAWC